MTRVNIALTLMVGIVLSVMIWKHPPSAWTAMQGFGMCSMIAGFVLWTTARVQLGKSFTVSAQAKQLLTAGLYSRIRNPIYVFGSSDCGSDSCAGAADISVDFSRRDSAADLARAKRIVRP